jgi:hypothetical protein
MKVDHARKTFLSIGGAVDGVTARVHEIAPASTRSPRAPRAFNATSLPLDRQSRSLGRSYCKSRKQEATHGDRPHLVMSNGSTLLPGHTVNAARARTRKPCSSRDQQCCLSSVGAGEKLTLFRRLRFDPPGRWRRRAG